MQEIWVWSLGQEDSLEEGMANHSSTLAWRIPWAEEPGRLQSIGSCREGHDWCDHAAAAWNLERWCWWTYLQGSNRDADIENRFVDTVGEGGEGQIERSALKYIYSVQFSSVAQSCLTLCDPMNRSTPGLPVHHQLLGFTQTHAHRVGDVIQPSHPLSSPSPPAPNPSQHQGLFQWVSSSHQMAKVLEFQLQHQSFQWAPRTDL